MKKRFDALDTEIGNTPLIDCSTLLWWEKNTLYIKDETKNSYGNNHYPRVYLELFKYYEQAWKIKPWDTVLETWTWSACLAFAMLGQALWYNCIVIYPESTDAAIKKKIQLYAEVIESTWWVEWFRELVIPTIKEKKAFFLNHSMWKKISEWNYAINEEAIRGMSTIWTEIVDVLDCVDYFLPIVGNGTSLLGPWRAIRNGFPSTNIVGVEMLCSWLVYNTLYWDYEEKFSIQPLSLLSRPSIRGTSRWWYNRPHIQGALDEWIVDAVTLVTDGITNQAYEEKWWLINILNNVPRWDTIQLPDTFKRWKTTRAALSAVLALEKKEQWKTFVIIGYDLATMHDAL